MLLSKACAVCLNFTLRADHFCCSPSPEAEVAKARGVEFFPLISASCAGALFSYGADIVDLSRGAAGYVDVFLRRGPPCWIRPSGATALLESRKRSTQLERLEVVETGRRRRWSDDEKLRIVTESFEAPRVYRRQQDAMAYHVRC